MRVRHRYGRELRSRLVVFLVEMACERAIATLTRIERYIPITQQSRAARYHGSALVSAAAIEPRGPAGRSGIGLGLMGTDSPGASGKKALT